MYALWIRSFLSILGPSVLLPCEDPFPAANASDVGLDQKTVDAIAADVQGWVESERVVGASLLLIKDRKTVLSEAWGWADAQARRPMEIGTICNIRSMTKPLTGMAAQILIDRGALSLDGLAAEGLEGFRADPYDRITLEHLLTHRSGLALTVIDGVLDRYPSIQALANAASTKPLLAGVGQAFWYSDAGTEVVGALVEQASGATLDSFVTEHVLRPLGMKDSFYDLDADDPRRDRMATGYVGARGHWTPIWSSAEGPMYPFAWGSQSLYSTPVDYARFLACWLDLGLAPSGSRVVSRESVQRALTPRSAMTATGTPIPYPSGFFGLEVCYGQMAMVWRESGDAGSEQTWTLPPVVGHGGSDGTMAWAFPEHDLIALCFTQSRGQTLALSLEALLQRLIDPESVVEFPESWRVFLGSYLANFGPFVNAEITLIEQNGRLAIELGGRGAYTLTAPEIEGERWIATGAPMFEFSFVREAEAVVALTFHTRGQAFHCPRGEANPVPAIDIEQVAELVGEYRVDSDGETMRVLIQGRQLAVEIHGLPGIHPLMPTKDPLAWRLRAAPGVQVKFERGAAGEILSCIATGTGRPPIVRHRVGEQGPAEK